MHAKDLRHGYSKNAKNKGVLYRKVKANQTWPYVSAKAETMIHVLSFYSSLLAHQSLYQNSHCSDGLQEKRALAK